MAISWKYYPLNKRIPKPLLDTISIFEKNYDEIKSTSEKLESNEVLKNISGDLEQVGFIVEKGKKRDDKIRVPVLYGRQGKVDLAFEADALWRDEKIVLEVEAGRGVTNYQFLKDLFQACMMDDVEYFAVAVRQIYRTSQDYEKVINFFDALYASNKLILPLKGVLVIGY